MNFKNLQNNDKASYQKQLLEKIELFGSINSFLKLIEEIRTNTPHPLMASPTRFNASSGFIKWDKIIFKDKLVLLSQIYNKKDNQILPEQKNKDYKKYLNLVKTINPIIFKIKPKLRDDGDGFECTAFDCDENNKATKLSFMFKVIFFANMVEIKEILNFNF